METVTNLSGAVAKTFSSRGRSLLTASRWFTPTLVSISHPVCRFSLAVHEPYTDSGTGERIERTTWFQIVAWNRLSEIASQYLKKGDQVLVEGRIQLREFKGRDGTKRAMLQVIASRIEFGAKSLRTDAGNAAPADDSDRDGDEAPEDFTNDLAADEDAEDFVTPDDDSIPF
jgi:single-strand DNA-binding protein